MPRSQLTLEQRWAKYKISRERFDDESSALLEAGFTNDQAKTLIIRQSSSNTVKAVLTNYKTLLAQPYALNHQQIIIIASHDGGSRKVYGIVEKNAAEDAVSDFLYFLNTVLASPSEKNPSQNGS